jgi:hypothetical protein
MPCGGLVALLVGRGIQRAPHGLFTGCKHSVEKPLILLSHTGSRLPLHRGTSNECAERTAIQ